MSDHLPIVEVPESTWLRALAHALDPEADSPDDSLAPDDDPVPGSSDELDVGDDSDDDHDDDRDDDDVDDDVDGASPVADDADAALWDTDDSWSPADDADDPGAHHDLHDDDGIG